MLKNINHFYKRTFTLKCKGAFIEMINIFYTKKNINHFYKRTLTVY